MAEVPSRLVLAAAALGLDAGRLRPLAGNSGSAWDAGGAVLCFASGPGRKWLSRGQPHPLLTWPVPGIIDRADFGDMTAVLLERLPGRDAGVAALPMPALAEPIGRACGAVHDRLATVPAPGQLARAAAADGAARTEPGWPALVQGWTESGGLDVIPPAARAWACRFMLADLASRYRPGDLAHVRYSLDQAEADTSQQADG